MANSSGSRVEQHREKLQRQGAQLGKDVGQIGDELKDAARDEMEHVSSVANEYLERGREEAMALADSFEDQVREKPMRSVLVAAGVGFLFGILWVRR
jgi:ElaB/YqjD/DUF883 family membrane-anchored ribosome-binding protein